MTALVRADLEPPVAGRPEHFSGAVGVYRIQAEATPVELRVEESVALTVTITGTVAPDYPRFHPPERLKMDDLADLQDDFQVDDLAERNSHPDAHTWKYHYRLRPRNTQVRQIPRLSIVYFNPQNNTWPKSYVDHSIPLKVKPRAAVAAAEHAIGPGVHLGQRFPLAKGSAVLREKAPIGLPGPWFMALLFAGPPVLCLLWHRAWRSWYPDAARSAGLRRSRASRLALKALRAIPRRLNLQEKAAKVVMVVGRYLHQRLDLPTAEPTPVEVAALMKQTNVAPAVGDQFAGLLATCDAARFAPESLAPDSDLAAAAARLIRELEAERCLSATSS